MQPIQTIPQNFIPLQIQPQEEELTKKHRIGNAIMIIAFIFLTIMLFFSSIGYASIYNQDALVLRHIKVFNTYMRSTEQNSKDVPALKQYFFHQHEADYIFGLLLFIMVLGSFGLWMLIFLNKRNRNILNSRLSHFLLFFLNLLICVCCIVCFSYYMNKGEDYEEKLENIQNHIGTWAKGADSGASAYKHSLEYIQGYVDSIVDIIRPFAIIDFIVAIIYIIISFALIGMQASKEGRAFRPL